MKKIISFAMLVALASSCTSLQYVENTYVQDYRQYVEEGFYIYPKECSNALLKYVPISYIEIDAHPGKPQKGQDTSGLAVLEYGDPNTFADTAVPTYKYLTDKLVKKAKEMGANAIISFQCVRYNASGIAVRLQDIQNK